MQGKKRLHNYDEIQVLLKEGNFYFASTTGEKETILFLLESFKFQLLSAVWDEA